MARRLKAAALLFLHDRDELVQRRPSARASPPPPPCPAPRSEATNAMPPKPRRKPPVARLAGADGVVRTRRHQSAPAAVGTTRAAEARGPAKQPPAEQEPEPEAQAQTELEPQPQPQPLRQPQLGLELEPHQLPLRQPQLGLELEPHLRAAAIAALGDVERQRLCRALGIADATGRQPQQALAALAERIAELERMSLREGEATALEGALNEAEDRKATALEFLLAAGQRSRPPARPPPATPRAEEGVPPAAAMQLAAPAEAVPAVGLEPDDEADHAAALMAWYRAYEPGKANAAHVAKVIRMFKKRARKLAAKGDATADWRLMMHATFEEHNQVNPRDLMMQPVEPQPQLEMSPRPRPGSEVESEAEAAAAPKSEPAVDPDQSEPEPEPEQQPEPEHVQDATAQATPQEEPEPEPEDGTIVMESAPQETKPEPAPEPEPRPVVEEGVPPEKKEEEEDVKPLRTPGGIFNIPSSDSP